MPFDLSNFDVLLPRAVEWARAQEERILQEGVPLDAWEIQAARRAGVAMPQKVRLLEVDHVPLPADADLCAAAAAAGLITGTTLGMSLRYGIFVRDDAWRDRRIIAHELVHTGQCEKLGWELYLRQYLRECFDYGYNESPMEQEAVRLSQEIMEQMGHE
jgi:hypothetical protein